MAGCSNCGRAATTEAVVPVCDGCKDFARAFTAALQPGVTNEFGVHLSDRRKALLEMAQRMGRDLLASTIKLADPAVSDAKLERAETAIREMWQAFTKKHEGERAAPMEVLQ